MPLIKRYPNRKLYNTETKEYITLDRVADLICQGQEVTVVDHLTGDDLTAVTLTQIIFEQAKRQKNPKATPLLTQLIRMGRQHWQELGWDIIPFIPNGSFDRFIEQLLESYHIPTKGDITRLANELEALTARIEQLSRTKAESRERNQPE